MKLLGYEHREAQWGAGGAGKGKHTLTHTQCHGDTQGQLSLEQGSDTILTHVGVAPPQIKLMGYEYREDAVGGGGAGNSKHTQTHTHTHTHTVSTMIDRVEGASGNDR